MNRRILLAIVAVTAAALVVFGVPLGLAIRRFYADEATLTVQREAVLSSIQIPLDAASRGLPFELRSTRDTSFAFYDTAGRRMAGAGPDLADDMTRDALAADPLGSEVATVQTGERIVVVVPVATSGVIIGALRAEQSDDVYENRMRGAMMLIAALGGLILVAAGGVALWLAKRLDRPIRRTRDVAVAIGEGDFTARTTPVGIGELDELGAALNAMAVRIATLVDRERAFSADVSHQLRTPLTALALTLENEREDPSADRDQVLREALLDVERLSRTVDDLLALARDTQVERGPLDLAAMAARVDSRWRNRLAGDERALVVEVAEGAERSEVRVSSHALDQAIDVLMGNAAMHGAGTVTFSVERVGAGVVIAVTDQGRGVDEPAAVFVRRNPDAAGHGIGLALARTLIEAEGGRLVLARSRPHARFEIVLAGEGRTPAGRIDER